MKPYWILLFLLLLAGQAVAQTAFFDEADAFFQRHVRAGLVDYQAVQTDPAFAALLGEVARLDPADWPGAERQAFLLNAYNLLVIKGVTDAYPIASVMDVAGFFDRKRHQVAGRSVTLNELEKQWLLQEFPDPRLHFVLVCGALGCPPLIAEAYRPATLEAQLDRQTRAALDDPAFLRVQDSSQQVGLSQIFRWYEADFGGSQETVRTFIDRYRSEPLPAGYRLTYYDYDWSLNGTMAELAAPPKATNAARYVVSSTIPKNTTETKIFNNLYTQRTRNEMGDFTERATFFTTLTSFLYGVSHRVNVGFDLRYRSVRYGGAEEGAVQGVLDPTRAGITSFGPKVRIAPVPRWTNFSIQSALWFQFGEDLAGRQGIRPFLDWEGPIWWTQVFNDFPLGNQFSLFTEVDFMLEDIGSREAGRLNRFSTPVVLIGSYFPTSKATVYALGSYSPFWQENFDYFWQAGLGTKYQFNPNFELELSYTYFSNQFLAANQGQAGTYNLGVRFNL